MSSQAYLFAERDFVYVYRDMGAAGLNEERRLGHGLRMSVI
jgi:hypothetical protein